jgi:hypothetical protein
MCVTFSKDANYENERIYRIKAVFQEKSVRIQNTRNVHTQSRAANWKKLKVLKSSFLILDIV